jgi:hypothetical protein
VRLGPFFAIQLETHAIYQGVPYYPLNIRTAVQLDLDIRSRVDDIRSVKEPVFKATFRSVFLSHSTLSDGVSTATKSDMLALGRKRITKSRRKLVAEI